MLLTEWVLFNATFIDFCQPYITIETLNSKILFQLIYPSAMDPAGILMLRSFRIVFEKVGIQPESMKFKKDEIDSTNLIEALNKNPKKFPAIVTFDICGSCSTQTMVAISAIQGKQFTVDPLLHEKWFIKCKNSYRDDISEPGNFWKSIFLSFMIHSLWIIDYKSWSSVNRLWLIDNPTLYFQMNWKTLLKFHLKWSHLNIILKLDLDLVKFLRFTFQSKNNKNEFVQNVMVETI